MGKIQLPYKIIVIATIPHLRYLDIHTLIANFICTCIQGFHWNETRRGEKTKSLISKILSTLYKC